MKDEDYKLLSNHSSYGGKFSVGVKVFLAGVELTEDEKYELGYSASKIHDKILMIKAQNDPENKEIKIKTVKELTDCFPEPIYVEEIPNGYCSDYCCVQYPWLIVTCAGLGRIKIGWRKRVINIDWSDSTVKWTGDELFPKEETTKGDNYIHAWGYDKAKEYIKVLLKSELEHRFEGMQQIWEDSVVESGHQKYRYIVKNDRIIGIKCLLCDCKSYDLKSVDEQWCYICKVHHFTPN